MRRAELPAEFDGLLSWQELLSALASIDGEDIFLTVRSGRASVRTQGRLHRTTSSPQEAAYEVVDAERGAVRCCFSLVGATLESARLLTFDGNDYFRLFIDLKDQTIVLADEDSGP